MYHVLHPSGALDERREVEEEEEEEEEEENLAQMCRHYSMAEGGGGPGGSYGCDNNRELTQNEQDQVRHSRNDISA